MAEAQSSSAKAVLMPETQGGEEVADKEIAIIQQGRPTLHSSDMTHSLSHRYPSDCKNSFALIKFSGMIGKPVTWKPADNGNPKAPTPPLLILFSPLFYYSFKHLLTIYCVP